MDAALGGYKARHCLGIVYAKQGRWSQAAAQWQAVLAERGDHLPTFQALGEIYIEQQAWDQLEEIIQGLEQAP